MVVQVTFVRCMCLAAMLVVAACGSQLPGGVATPAATPPDATAAAAAVVIAAVLDNDAGSPAPGEDVAAAPTALSPSATPNPPPATNTAAPLSLPAGTSTPTASATATLVPTQTALPATSTPTQTPDLAAAATANALAIETAVAATLNAQPTVTPNWAATQVAEEQMIAAAIAATLAAHPTATYTPLPPPTPRPRATPTPIPPTPAPPAVQRFSIGSSARGRALDVVEIGRGDRTLILVGGLHAGSAPSTVSLAQQAADYFTAHPEEVPRSFKLAILVNANPDAGYAPGKLEGRLNANGVDLNRNWDCDWQPQAKWRDHTVSGGSAPLSEPETQALAAYILGQPTAAVVFWEAKMENGQVSAGGCGDRTFVSQPVAELYGRSAGYVVEPWTWYPVNGDASNWLDRQGIPAVSVLILDYERVDWENNLRGIRSLLDNL